MKKFLVTLFILGCFNLNAQQKVTVKMPLADTSKYVQLGHYYGYKQFFKVDSAKVDKNGLLVFNSPEGAWKGGAYVIVPSASKLYDFIYSGTEKDIFMEFDTTDYTNSVKFRNSPENEHAFAYRRFLSDISKKGTDLQVKLKGETNPEKAAEIRSELGNLQKIANAELRKRSAEKPDLLSSKLMLMNLEPELPEKAPLLANGKTDSTFMYRTFKAHFFDNVVFNDERMIRTPFLEKKLEQYFTNLVYQKADSLIKETTFVLNKAKANKEVYRYVLWYLTNKYETSDVVGLDRVVVHLYENYYLKDADWVDADQKKKFRDRLNIIKPVQTGNVMPTLILKDSEGKSHNLNDIKAKYTIVYFYSPTCGHCKDSAPALVKFQDENRSKGIEVLNVSTDPERKLQEMKDFMKTYDTGRMLNLYDPEHKYDFFSAYDVYSTPTLYLLDENKRILAKRLPIEDVNGFISFYEKNK